MIFDMHITIGNVLEIFAICISCLYAVYDIKMSVALMKQTSDSFTTRLSSIEDELKKLSEVIITLARQEERLRQLENRQQENTARNVRMEGVLESIQTEGSVARKRKKVA